MARLREETLNRVETFADRVLDVAEAIDKQGRFARIIDQMAGSGTSVGANVFEADQAMTPKDFVKTLGVVVKELNETKHWLRLVVRRKWIRQSRLAGLLSETNELLSIFNTMILRTRRRAKQTK